MRHWWVALVWTAIAGCYGGLEEHRELGLEGVERAFPFQEPDEIAHGWFLVDDDYRTLQYEVVDGMAVFEGDIVLGRVDELTAEERGERDPDRSTVRPDKKWKNGVVPYAFDPALADSTKTKIAKAIAHWEKHTKIRFVKRTDQKDYVAFQGGAGCSSAVGRQGDGVQFITLSKKYCDLGAAIHEIGHAVGLYHEQSRTDRDEHIVIHWDRIAPGMEHNFLTYAQWGELTGQQYKGANIGAYDFGSIMHYPEWAFSVDGSPTITRAHGNAAIEGQRNGLSAGDKKGVAFLYGSPTQNDDSGPDGPTQDEPVPDAGATEAAHACWVAELYRDVLAREPDAVGHADWAAALDNGMAPGEVAGGFVRSDEALDGFLRGLYSNLLRREPDAGGLADWKAAMAAGKSKESARAEFIASGEYWSVVAGGDRRRFVEMLYQDVLGRIGAVGEIDGWLAAIGALDSVEGRLALANEFLRSAEGRARTIEDAYARLLHRASDAGGKAAYLEAMQNGLVEEVLAIELLISSEYQQRCAG